MAARIGVYEQRGNGRSQRIARALCEGARCAGYNVASRNDGQYSKPIDDMVAFYGYQKNLPQIFKDYTALGRKVIFVDLGYWGRRAGGRWKGYHKVSINARHPTAYFMDKPMPDDRLRVHDVKVEPWQRDGDYILVAGMSRKSAESYGMHAEQWERWAIRELQKHTKRTIIYRPKPSWNESNPIPGALLQTRLPIERALKGCHAVVTHHSNVAVEAIAAGVPAFCWDGVAAPMSLQCLSKIEKPWRPDGREQWLANIAWCQWSVDEIRTGKMFRILREQGMIP